MAELFLIGTASLLLGMRHATDPDHILAVSTIVCRDRSLRGVARIGAMWGLGHGFTLALLGGAVIAFRLALTPRVGLSLEFAVALMLIVLGALAIAQRNAVPRPTTSLRPFAVGLVHGAAGSAAASVLVVAAISDVRWGLIYLLVFSIGTLVGMAIMTSLLVAPSLFVAQHDARTTVWVRTLAGALTLAFGCYVAFRIGIVEGLLIR